jgi:hypothetical protein
MVYNVVLGKKEWGLAKVFLPNQNIFKIKKLDSMLMLQTTIGAKITIQDSKKLFNSLI